MECLESSKVKAFVKLFPFHTKLATLLFENMSDVSEFTSKFYKSNKYEIDDLLDFRHHKLKKSNITLSVFLDKCDTDVKLAFESTFLQSFDEDTISLVKEAVHSNMVTFDAIFKEFHKNTDINVLKHIISI